jgi:hypothetical protein
MMTSEQCRAYAAECRELAQTAASAQKKSILLDLARHWDMAQREMQELERQKAADKQIQALKSSAGAD